VNDRPNGEPLRVTVVGLGYVGLTTAVGLTALGHTVTGVDIDCHRLALLQQGTVPIHEPGLQAGLREHAGKMAFTGSLEEALGARPDIVMIAVQTSAERGDAADTAFVEEAAVQIGRHLLAPATVVLRSTAPPGSTARIRELASAAFGAPLAVAANPEFLVEGRAYEEFLGPDRIVIGVDDNGTAEVMRRLYAPLDAPLVVTDIATAELSKFAANAFLATEISFINEIADVADALGADVMTVSRILKLDKRIGERAYLTPGLGYGGSCLPKDLRALTQAAEYRGVAMRLAHAVADVNDGRADRMMKQLSETIGDVVGRQIAVWGLAFKGGTADVRESPALSLVSRLLAAGAHVLAYDPVAESAAEPFVGAAVLCDGMYEPLCEADALLVLTACPEFAAPDYNEMRSRMRGRLIIDGRNVIRPEAARDAGFVYLGVGASHAGGVPTEAGKERQST
jgi:UDPglucose 6-dehydrogenase